MISGLSWKTHQAEEEKLMKESVLPWESGPGVDEMGSRTVTLKRSHFSWGLESPAPPLAPACPPSITYNRQTD